MLRSTDVSNEQLRKQRGRGGGLTKREIGLQFLPYMENKSEQCMTVIYIADFFGYSYQGHLNISINFFDWHYLVSIYGFLPCI